MRNYTFLTDGWYFTKTALSEVPTSLPRTQDSSELPTGWTTVTLPHSWNNFDGQDGGGDYHRGKCWYVKELNHIMHAPNAQLYIEFGAASSVCEVYLNGQQITRHEGGYSIFRANLTPYLKEKNILAVLVDNSHMDTVYPQMADFTFYGGLYREVRLIEVPETHFDLDYFGSEGITVSSEITGDCQAMVTFHAFVSNPRDIDQVIFTVIDQDGTEIASIVRPAESDTHTQLILQELHLWQGVKDPYLYTVEAVLMRHNEVQDLVSVRHGFRKFHVDPQLGFYLNGELTPLRGVSRHQDRLGIGNALTFDEHLEDALLIREVGANTVRLAHYQHSQDFYDLCDSMGFIVWAEIPFISRMNSDPDAHRNCISQMKELICQNYNHSSICFWGISNEITIGGTEPLLVANLKELNDLCHELDPTRLTTMAQVSMLPMDDVQNEITDVVSYNHYFGWYGGSVTDNEKWLDEFHSMHPNRALGISEYGCEGIVTYHNDAPKAGDYSEEYQTLYHEHMAKIIEERPWLWATHIWNMFDFGCDARDEGGVAGRNNKGLVTLDRLVKKDSFYLYKAYWSEEPFLHICSRRYAKRTDEAITVKVYSNLNEVELFLDGCPYAQKQGSHVFTFENIPLKEGFTTITVKSGPHSDTTVFEKTAEPFAAYEYVDPEAGETGVSNWFDTIDLSEKKELTFDEHYYSIRDQINTLLENDDAAAIVVNAFSSMMKMNVKKSMMKIMGQQTLEDMTSTMPPKEEIDMNAAMAYINAELQKIKK